MISVSEWYTVIYWTLMFFLCEIHTQRTQMYCVMYITELSYLGHGFSLEAG